MNRHLRDASHLYLYLGLLWQRAEGIRFSNGTDLRSVLAKFHKTSQTPISIRNFLVSLSQTGRELEANFRNLLSKADTASALNEEYLRFAGQVFDLLEMAAQLRHQIVLPDWKIEGGKAQPQERPDTSAKPADTLQSRMGIVLRQFFNLEFNVRQQRYTLAVSNLTRILEELLTKDSFAFKKEFLRHANFMATVAEARDSREVAAAIELFALPPGSSRMKKQSNFSVSLNSYGGLAYGWEQDFDDAVNEAIDGKSVLSASAPLGIDINFGLGDAGSLSLYSQLIDVGAVFAFRFTDETSNIPELKFQNLLAPGFYGVYGFGKNLPLSVGAGAQLGPNLRKVDPSAGLQVETTSAWRFGFFLSVDIPVTHFYSK
jgi:hypothetical protein